MLELLNYVMVKRTLLDQLKEELSDIWDVIVSVFEMIKTYTYDIIAKYIGSDIALLLVIGVGIVGLMIILISIINH